MTSKLYSYAGIAASIVLIAFGAGATYMGVDGRDRVRDDLAREMIVGTPDSSIPGQKVDTGKEAEAFAAVIRKHTLEANRRPDVRPDGPLLGRERQADVGRGGRRQGPEDR